MIINLIKSLWANYSRINWHLKMEKNLAEHLIKIENNLDEWWYQSKIQRNIKLFLKNTNIIVKDPIVNG